MLDTLDVIQEKYSFYNINKAAQRFGYDVQTMPYSMRVVFENLLRNNGKGDVDEKMVCNALLWLSNGGKNNLEIEMYPSRVLMQDFTGVPGIVDLAAMRDFVKQKGGNPKAVNPLIPVDLVVDHSVQVDFFGTVDALQKNADLENERNKERYELFKWAQGSFDNLTVVPPGMGICHQVNLEFLARVVFEKDGVLYPDSVIGTDSHTTMINGLSVLGWGVGGIEAQAAMLGQPLSMMQPEIVGMRLIGRVAEGVTATDIVLTITQILRKENVVDKFVEFFGDGLNYLSLPDRATIANMAPEYGATCGFFSMDEKTIDYLRLTGRSEKQLAIIESYGKANFMWRDASADDKLIFTKVVELDLSDVIPSLAGPKRPQDRVDINKVSQNFKDHVKNATVADKNILGDGSVVIAAITSCTNTSNPSVMIAAGLLAKKAVERGLKVPSFVKTSLAPGSQVVSEYLQISGLQQYLDALGFNTVGYGCTTCIGNSGPLIPEVEKNIKENNISVASVLSGNRNFENRVHALVGANYLASPPLVVAFALLGNVLLDINAQPLGIDVNGKEVFLRDIWPSHDDVSGVISAVISDKIYKKRYADVYKGDAFWQNLQVAVGSNFAWKKGSTYVENPPYFTAEKNDLGDIKSAHILAILGDSVTTDHISPAGAIADNSPAALYLKENGVQKNDFNSYGSRRGSHSVMMRGTFSNAKIKNSIADVPSGAFSKYVPTGEIGTIFDVAMRYIESKQPTVIIAGKEYGTGSSRDWAAKGTNLLGVKAVIAESFERIHRSNLVGMGVMPLQFINITVSDLKLCGSEQISIFNLDKITPNCTVDCKISYADGTEKVVQLKCLIKTQNELLYYRSGGVMQFVAAKLN